MSQRLQRGAGILLPIFSLPSPYGIGTLGKEAREFAVSLKKAGQKYWQVLPTGPTGYGDSPYQSFSAFAGNPYLIDLPELIKEGLLREEEAASKSWGERLEAVDYGRMYQNRRDVLYLAFTRFFPKGEQAVSYERFQFENRDWLPDYCLFAALKHALKGAPLGEWPEDLRLRRPEALQEAKRRLQSEICFQEFCQFQFFRQWEAFRKVVREQGIDLIGDLPIYASMDSADVWAHPELFQLDERRRPVAVAGVPPDAFTELGQLWGNPLYDWEQMERDHFTWWRSRMQSCARLFDAVRLDHFIGIVRYYGVPAGAEDARGGDYFPGPGRKLLEAISEEAGETKIIAEDLGVFLPEVKALLSEMGYPNMKVLEFGFDGGPDNEHAPHNYSRNCVVYGGTHDNETMAGYLDGRSDRELSYAYDYFGVSDRKALQKAMIRAAYASVADVAIFQMQDILGLGNKARMNFPGHMGGNWQWRLLPGQVTEAVWEELRNFAWLYGR
ncbi:4-alpha-glucanotransferase [Hominifimenecus sp. rT4P-3]|uniref:4-alpha-glucanotransferase n=1 Tax=Hominifimenecus sp. rT4P-3 TaxID=3242979 RepID=UPI003DA298BD